MSRRKWRNILFVTFIGYHGNIRKISEVCICFIYLFSFILIALNRFIKAALYIYVRSTTLARVQLGVIINTIVTQIVISNTAISFIAEKTKKKKKSLIRDATFVPNPFDPRYLSYMYLIISSIYAKNHIFLSRKSNQIKYSNRSIALSRRGFTFRLVNFDPNILHQIKHLTYIYIYIHTRFFLFLSNQSKWDINVLRYSVDQMDTQHKHDNHRIDRIFLSTW